MTCPRSHRWLRNSSVARVLGFVSFREQIPEFTGSPRPPFTLPNTQGKLKRSQSETKGRSPCGLRSCSACPEPRAGRQLAELALGETRGAPEARSPPWACVRATGPDSQEPTSRATEASAEGPEARRRHGPRWGWAERKTRWFATQRAVRRTQYRPSTSARHTAPWRQRAASEVERESPKRKFPEYVSCDPSTLLVFRLLRNGKIILQLLQNLEVVIYSPCSKCYS